MAYLTGLPNGPPDFSRAVVLGRAERVAAAAGARLHVPVDAAGLLAGRAGLLGLTRRGRGYSAARHRDGWCAVTLSRPDDISGDPWPRPRP